MRPQPRPQPRRMQITTRNALDQIARLAADAEKRVENATEEDEEKRVENDAEEDAHGNADLSLSNSILKSVVV